LRIPALDGGVYEDYARKLLPRAVGYSAGLIKYFFRGNIEITLPNTGAYASTEDPVKGFTKITLLAKNASPEGEEMPDGKIELVVKYKLALGDPFQSLPVPTTDEFVYTVVPGNFTRSIPRTNPVELVFDLTEKPIPLNATDLYLQVVYKGKLGKEEEGVWKGELEGVAVGFKDISEPTPIDLFNDMDRICINGSWYVAGSQEAIDLGNQFNFDAYPHDLKNIYLRFSPINAPQDASPAMYNLHIEDLHAGQYYIRKTFILSDYEFNNSCMVRGVVNADPNDPYVTWMEPYRYSVIALKNQTEYVTTEEGCRTVGLDPPCYIRYYPTFNRIRNVEMWDGPYFSQSYPPNCSCPQE
jgi:hypothetical protein